MRDGRTVDLRRGELEGAGSRALEWERDLW